MIDRRTNLEATKRLLEMGLDVGNLNESDQQLVKEKLEWIEEQLLIED